MSRGLAVAAGLRQLSPGRWLDPVSPETARALPVVVPVAIAGAAGTVAAVIALVLDPLPPSSFVGLLGLLAAAAVAEAFPLPIEGVSVGATSLATVFIVAAAVLYGWEGAAGVGFLTMVLVEVSRRRPLIRVAYNTALYVCAAIAAGLAAEQVGARDDLAAVALQAVLGSAAFYLVDIGLLAALVARVRDGSVVGTARRYVTSTGLPSLIMASLTVTLVVLWERSPFVAIVLVGPLLTIALYERSLHRVLERLRELDRLKDEFIAVISHELRTPLTSVYGAALTLQQKELRDDVRRSLLSIVSDEAGRLARLLDDALRASRLDAGGETFDIVPVECAEVVEAVLDAARSRAPAEIELQLVSHESLPPVAADRDKLRQVLVNLVENAVKYSPDGGRVEVRLERVDHRLRFTVADDGLGIPAHEQARVFDKFHRLDPHMTRGVGGSGLGLYICRELVTRMGGRIWMSSQEGRGSTFSFELPLVTTGG